MDVIILHRSRDDHEPSNLSVIFRLDYFINYYSKKNYGNKNYSISNEYQHIIKSNFRDLQCTTIKRSLNICTSQITCKCTIWKGQCRHTNTHTDTHRTVSQRWAHEYTDEQLS